MKWSEKNVLKCVSVVLASVLSLAAFGDAGLGDFRCSVPFTVLTDLAGATEEGMPVLVRLSENSPVGFSYDDCDPAQMRFGDATLQPLPFEVDTWNPQGESLVWVKAPVVKDSVFTLFYDGTAAVANDPTGVWSEYTGVWHLNALSPETDASLTQSKGVYPNSTSESGIDGHLSTASSANEAGRFGSSFRVNDVSALSTVVGPGGVWVNDAGANSPLDADGEFTISGWFKHQDWNFWWDHLFYKRYNSGNSTDPTGSFALELNVNNTAVPNIAIRGASNKNTNQTCKNSLREWTCLTFVYSNTTCTVYQDGVQVGWGVIDKATDNDSPLVFGNNSAIATDAAGGDAAWQGWIDEVRYLKGVRTAAWVAAEYAAMAGDGLLSVGLVQGANPNPPPEGVILPGATPAETRQKLQDAIDAAAALSPTGTVSLFAATYAIDAQLMVTGGVTLVGQGWDRTVVKQTATTGLDKRVMTVSGGAKVERLTITGGYLTQVSGTGANWKNGAGAVLDDGTISWCCISNNASLNGNCNFGGGVIVSKGLIDHTIIADNRVTATTGSAATGGGIAVRSPSGDVTIDTCLICRNSSVNNAKAGLGGGVGIESLARNVTIRNTTIVGNAAGDASATAVASGGAIYSTGDSRYLKMVNCLIVGNSTVGDDGASVKLSYSDGVDTCLFDLPGDDVGSNGIVGDPKLADAANGDYRLTADSPAVDAGVSVGGSWTDLDGVTYATAPAIGCYGFGTPVSVVALTIATPATMQLVSVEYEGKKAVRNEAGDWSVPVNATVTVSFIARAGYELTGNPVRVTLTAEPSQTLTVFPTATAITLPDDGVKLEKLKEHEFSVDACGGITYSGHDNLFYLLRDHEDDGDWKAKVYPVTLDIDQTTGDFTTAVVGTAFTPGSNTDSEGIAYDAASGKLWISDEGYPPTIAEFGLDGTASGRTVSVPEPLRSKVREGVSLESLTLSPDGLTMWTANEEALECDGEKSSTTVQTVVRLTKFTRADADSAWVPDGQWAYACDVCQASLAASYLQCGVSGLCALPDGSLLVLEREVSTTTWGRCRIYRVTSFALSKATEVSSISSLATTPYTGVAKGTCLVEIKGGGMSKIIVYEGIALGPKLSDGSYGVYLVSDGGATASISFLTAKTVNRICALKLSGLREPGDDSGWDVPGATGGINGLSDGKGGKCIRFNSISLAKGQLKIGFEADRVDANGQSFGLLCKDSLADEVPYVINVQLTNDEGGMATLGTLQGLTDKPQIFILGIGPAVR